jgi:L-threonylcarbamoyladenylate synthase
MTEAQIAACLTGGGVVVLPTDTVYGIAASPTHPDAVERIFQLKARPNSVNLPIMVADPAALIDLGLAINPRAAHLLASPLVPGGLTLVLGFVEGPRPVWLNGREEVAVRIPDHAPLLAILRLTGPLLVTSANAHGAGSAETLDQVLAQLAGRPDLAIDGGVLHTTPSTLVNCRTDPPTVERLGAIPAETIAEYLA